MAKKTKRNPIFGKIADVCAPDESSVINRVLVRGGKLIATDGYILAIRDIPKDCPNGDLLNVDALIPQAVAKKLAKVESLEIETGSMGSVTVKTGDTLTSIPSNGYTSASFPRYNQIIPDNKGFEVTLNAAFLKRLADAISSDGCVTLTFGTDRLKPVNVKGDEGSGVIMPVRP